MKDYARAFAAVDALTDEYINLWEELGNIESPTDDKAGVDAVCARVTAHGRSLGFEAEIYPVTGSGDPVCLIMNPGAKGRPIAFSAHMDTVHAKGLFGYPPVTVDREHDVIRGPGVNDDKSGAVAALLAMHALKTVGFADRPLYLLLQTDEETNSSGSGKATIRRIIEKAKDCAAFFNCEAISVRVNAAGEKCPGVVTGRKGIARYRFTVTGRGIHACACHAGASAIAAAAHIITFLEDIPKDPAGITVSVGLIRGGSAPNAVPERCEFEADTRFATFEEADRIDELMKQAAGKCGVAGTACTVECFSKRVSMEKCERNEKLYADMNAAFLEAGLPALDKRFSGGGSDAADVTAAGIPCIDSIGTEGGGEHTLKEWSRLSSLAEAAKRLACLAIGLAD